MRKHSLGGRLLALLRRLPLPRAVREHPAQPLSALPAPPVWGIMPMDDL